MIRPPPARPRPRPARDPPAAQMTATCRIAAAADIPHSAFRPISRGAVPAQSAGLCLAAATLAAGVAIRKSAVPLLLLSNTH